MSEKKGKFFVGTSGWHYKHWIGKFYPEKMVSKDLLDYYDSFFDTLELNNSFYKLPSSEQFSSWYKNTPEGFLFSIKASRYITHIKRLNMPTEGIKKLIDSISALKEKLGPILFQLPPNMKLNIQRLEEFISYLPSGFRYTFEFRHPSWYHEDVYELLKKNNCAFCIYELNHHMSPVVTTADFVYIRLHGPEEKYSGDYSPKQLNEWAESCKNWLAEGKDVYVYFDNDQNAYAPFNALSLKETLQKGKKKHVKQNYTNAQTHS
ncbi:MAG: DUF72 domain-containing protein [Sporocytophaga sp.]|nr:DUF72 domain-containing protein [Sporocytophaga sp.]